MAAQKQGSNITPIKLGLKFTPPSLVLIYNDKSKLRSRTIPVKDLDILTDLAPFTKTFKANDKYRKYFDKIGEKKLEKQFFILQDYMKGYTLSESLERAKKYDDGELTCTDKRSDLDDTKSDDNDFKDTDDEDEKKSNPFGKKPSQSDNKTTSTTNNSNQQQSKSTALDLLSTQLKSVKANLFDFEEDVDEEVKTDDEDDDEEADVKDILNFGSKKAEKKPEEKFEVPKHDDSSEDSSF